MALSLRLVVAAMCSLIAVSVNVTQSTIKLDQLFIGVWDFYTSDGGSLFVQHKLVMNASEFGGVSGVLSVVSTDALFPVAKWDVFLEENEASGTLAATSFSDDGAHSFVCPFTMRAIAPGVISSASTLHLSKEVHCNVFARIENSSHPLLSLEVSCVALAALLYLCLYLYSVFSIDLTRICVDCYLQVFDSSARLLYAATGTRRKSNEDAPFLQRYGMARGVSSGN